MKVMSDIITMNTMITCDEWLINKNEWQSNGDYWHSTIKRIEWIQ